MPPASGQRILHRLKARGARTARELGGDLGMSAVGARQHLARLAARGLVEFEDRRQAVGRPRRHWHLTDAAQAGFPDRHSDLTLELLDAVGAVFGEAGLEKLMAARLARALAAHATEMADAADLESRVRRLAEIRQRQGFMAEWRADVAGFLLIENHCPIGAAARRCPGLCRSELDVFRKVLGPGVSVMRIDHVLAGDRRCAYRIASAAGARPGVVPPP